MPKRVGQKAEFRDTVIIEPRTSVSSFDGLQWSLQKAVSGAIASFLFGDNEEGRKQFFPSPTNRKNKQKLAQLAGQVYGYLNSTISEHADIPEYYFRVWTRVEIERQTGEITGDPRFDVDLFRYLGRVSTKPIAETNQVEITFVGAPDDDIVSPHFARMLRKAVTPFPRMAARIALDPRSVGPELKAKLWADQPCLFVGPDLVFPVTMETASGKLRLYIAEGEGRVEIRTPDDLGRFLIERSGVKPEILGLDTAFVPVDQEVQRISAKVSGGADVKPGNLLLELQIGETLEKLEKQFAELRKQAGEGGEEELRRLEAEVEKVKRSWVELKSRYEAVVEEMDHLSRDFDQKRVTFDTFSVHRFQAINQKKAVEQQLVELQEEVKGSLWRRIMSLFKKDRVVGNR